MNDPLLIDTDIWVEGERQPAVIANWLADQGDVATCDTVRAEFLVGVHAPRQPATREKARRYFEEVIACTPSLPVDRADFDQAGRLIGDAIRSRAWTGRPTGGSFNRAVPDIAGLRWAWHFLPTAARVPPIRRVAAGRTRPSPLPITSSSFAHPTPPNPPGSSVSCGSDSHGYKTSSLDCRPTSAPPTGFEREDRAGRCAPHQYRDRPADPLRTGGRLPPDG